MSSTSISILVRTYNSEKTLVRLLSKLNLEQGDEIIVVDSASQDATQKVAKDFGAIVVEAPLPFNYSKSLNAGFRAARNPLVYVLSSHAIPMVPDLLCRMRLCAQRYSAEVWAFYGPSGISGKDDLHMNGSTEFGSENYREKLAIIGNANTLYRLSAWERLPFDENIRTDEDKTWARAAISLGCRLVYVPEAPILNKSNYSLNYMFRKGQSDARATKNEGAPPMSLRHLAGGLKKLAVKKLKGEIDWGNWIRYSAHVFGTYSGSRMPKDNSPRRASNIRP